MSGIRFYNSTEETLKLSIENRAEVNRILLPFTVNDYDVELSKEFLDITDTPTSVTNALSPSPIQDVVITGNIIEQYYSDLTDKTSFEVYDRPVLYKSGEEIVKDPSRYVIVGSEVFVEDVTGNSFIQRLIRRLAGTNNFILPVVEIQGESTFQQVRLAGTLDEIISRLESGQPPSDDFYVPLSDRSIYQVIDVTTEPRFLGDAELVDQNLFAIDPIQSSVYSIDQILNINDIDGERYTGVLNDGIDTIYVNNYGLPQTSIAKETSYGDFSLFDTFNQTYTLVNLDVIENEFDVERIAWNIEEVYDNRAVLPYGISQSVENTNDENAYKLQGRLLEPGTFVYAVTAEVYVNDEDINEPVYRYELIDRIQVTEDLFLKVQSNYGTGVPLKLVSSEFLVDGAEGEVERVLLPTRPLQLSVLNTPFSVEYSIVGGTIPNGVTFNRNTGEMLFDDINVKTIAPGEYRILIEARETDNPYVGRNGESLAREGDIEVVLIVEEVEQNRGVTLDNTGAGRIADTADSSFVGDQTPDTGN